MQNNIENKIEIYIYHEKYVHKFQKYNISLLN